MTDTFYGSDFGALEAFDPDIAGVLLSELDRLRGGLQLIASENFSSPEVLTALGSTLSNKYAEGYPGRRYYGGCSEVDKAETLAIERCKALFGADHANVQAHSGASANQAVYGAFLKPGEKILAMSLPHGGHLTHGTKVSFSRQVVRRRALRRRQGHRGHRLRPGRAARPRAPPQGDPRRRLGHPAADRLRALPRHRRRGRRDLLGRRRPLHRPGGRAGHPQPGAVRRRRLVHHAQGAARAALGRHRVQGRARRGHRQGRVPDDAGRPADALDRRQGGQLQGVRDARVRRLRAPGRRQRQGAGRGAR